MSERDAFTISVESCNSHVTLRAAGEIDLDAMEAMQAATEAAVALDPTWVGVDVAEVSFIDSSGLNALLALRKRCSAIGADVSVLNPSRQVLALLDMTGLIPYFLGRSSPEADLRDDG